VIESAPILPAQEEILRQDALVGSIHYSNLIEGNELPRVEALRAVKHELDPTDRAKLELVNYVAALEFIERAHREGTIAYSPEFLLHLHGVLTKGLGREGTRFLPRHEGAWRDGNIVVADAIQVYHEGPPADEVPNLMAERLSWLEGKRLSDEYPGPIVAGVGHFEINEIHPFADYNGRAARLFAVAVLYREGFMSRRLFSPERYYAEDKDAYYQALRAIKRTRNLNNWLGYYVNGLASEFERVAERVAQLSRLTHSLPLPLQLTDSQDKAVAALTVEGMRALTIPEYVELTGVSPRTASRELNALAEAGVLRARGTTRDRRFVLPVARTPSGGRPPTWTDERIRRSLTNLIEELGRWPVYRDFEAKSLLPLYAAIQRTGGEARWKPELQPSIPSYKN
jgi:Fic family protein